jgi:hypothetical protein
MPELELALVELGRNVAWPETPDLAPRARSRLAEGRQPRFAFPRRRALALALAVLAVAVGAVMAVPQTRAAILEFFGLRGVTIQRVEELPTVPRQTDLALGEPVEVDEVDVPWQVLVPAKLGEPDAAYYRPDPTGGGMVSLLYGTPEDPEAIFTQFQASVEQAFIKKALTDTEIEAVTIEGEPGYWLAGEPHFFTFVDADGFFQEETIRLAGNVLLWERGSLTLRLEADVSKKAALEIARSVE